MLLLKDVQNYILETYELTNMEEELLDELTFDMVDVEEAISYMQNIVNYGSISGCSKLVYNWDIAEYFAKFWDEIQYYLNEIGETYGGALELKDFTVSNMVWLAYDFMVGEFLDLYLGVVDELEEVMAEIEGEDEQ